jgi:hypothetical protein
MMMNVSAQRSEVFRAAFHKLPALRADDLLVDRLLEAVEASLRHAELDRIAFFLSCHCLRGNLTRHPFADCHPAQQPRGWPLPDWRMRAWRRIVRRQLVRGSVKL